MLPQFISSLPSCRILYNFHLKHISRIAALRLQHQLAKTKDPEYPPIIDVSTKGQERHQRQIWYNSIKAMPTAEEKLYELSVQQKLNSVKYLVNSVPSLISGVFFQNFITRTHLVKDLPDKINRMQVDTELSEIRDVLNEVIQNHYCNGWKNGEVKQLSDYLMEEEAGSNLAKSLIAQCFKKLAVKNEYIRNSTVSHCT